MTDLSLAPPADRSATGDVLTVTGLRTDIRLRSGAVHAVDGVSFHVAAGETLGIVGESGCGKTMTALSVMRLLPPGGHIVGGSVELLGRDLLALDDTGMRAVRGNDIGMIFQDPLTSLNPTMTIGAQIAEAVRLHRGGGEKAALARAVEVLDLVGISQAAARASDYPHQFSGGMRQRVMIAMALACEPRLLIADEPTTALDVTIQAQILELVDRLRVGLGMAVILVTHDLGVIAGHADRVAVMYAGQVVEQAPTDELFARPRHRYTEALFAALPDRVLDHGDPLLSIPGLPPDLTRPIRGCRFAARCRFADDACRLAPPPVIDTVRGEVPTTDGDLAHTHRCVHPVGTLPALLPPPVPAGTLHERDTEVVLSVEGLVKEFPVTRGLLQRRVGAVSAVAGVSFEVARGHTFGLVGESGCGKTTTGRLVAGLERATAGRVLVEGEDVASWRGRAGRRRRRSLQLMFQDSYASLDPRMRVGSIIREPLAIHGVGSRRDQERLVLTLLDHVALPRGAAERYPHELSGGQRQRVGLARALALSPTVIVADEPVSALDVSVQAQILNLMRTLQAEHDVTYVLISHDLGVVRYLADTIGVMYLGKLVEVGPADDVATAPRHPYTKGLIDAIPVPDPACEVVTVPVRGELPSALNPPSGCRFRTRCPLATDLCAQVEPPLTRDDSGHAVACHYPLA